MPRYQRECPAKAIKAPFLDCESQSKYPLGPGDAFNQKLSDYADEDPLVWYIDVESVICADATCSPYVNGVPLYHNPTHISMEGSWLIGRRLVSDAEAVAPLLEAVGDANPIQ